MKEFIEKLIEKIVNTPTKCLETQYCNSIQSGIKYGCASRQNEIIDMIKELAEEHSHCTLCYLQSPCEYQNENVQMPMEYWERGWIPCSERLPEANGWYLVTNELGVVQQQYWGASHWNKLRDEAVLAWQPLPDPYIEK